MAPRGRAPKKDTRMDAAIDALSAMGFPKPLIKRKVMELLKVYNGGWRFIEEFSYKVLLEAIIEDQENESEKKNSESMEDGVEPSTAQNVSKPSCDTDDDDNDDMVLVRRHRLKPSSSRTANEPSSTARPLNNKSSRAQQPNHVPVASSNRDEGPGSSVLKGFGDELRVSVTHHLPVSRKRCYGWMWSDGEVEGEEDFVFSETEAPRRKEMKRRMTIQEAQQKSRFDVE
ncbi:hypothetical protein ACHQM5_020947 [Ranunculus cassubicifolius]